MIIKKDYKIKYLFEQIFKGTNPPYVDEQNDYIIFGQRNNIKEGGISLDNCKYTTKSFWNKRIENEFLKYGDIIINALGGGTCGRVGYFDIKDKKILTDGIPYILRVSNPNKYLYYVLKSHQQDFENISIGATNQVSLTEDNLKNFKIELIDNSLIQNKVAKFLDDKIVEIDKVIAKTKETIGNYKKYRESLITESITKGIKKNKTMKETTNIFIPYIPSDWSMKKIKYIFFIKKEIAGKEGYNVLSITQNGIKIKDLSTNEGQLASDYSKYQLVNVGDFAMNHMDLLTGWIDISKYQGVTSPDYRVFNFINKEDYSERYYLYLMQMCYFNKIFYGLGQGVSNLGRWRLQTDKFLNFAVPVPSLKEQKEIVSFLDDKIFEIDNMIKNKEYIIRELEKYKKSVIYEYVTAKKEVI